MTTNSQLHRKNNSRYPYHSLAQPGVDRDHPATTCEADPRKGVREPIEPESGELTHPAHAERPAPKKPPPNSKPVRQNLSGVDSLPERSNREKDDGYRGVLFYLNQRWRVAACKDEIQWLLQRRDNTRWHSHAYCRTREGLARCIREYAGLVDAAALAKIAALPDWFGGGEVEPAALASLTALPEWHP